MVWTATMNVVEALETTVAAIAAGQPKMVDFQPLPTAMTTVMAQRLTIRVATAPVERLGRELTMRKMLVVSIVSNFAQIFGHAWLKLSETVYHSFCRKFSRRLASGVVVLREPESAIHWIVGFNLRKNGQRSVKL